MLLLPRLGVTSQENADHTYGKEDGHGVAVRLAEEFARRAIKSRWHRMFRELLESNLAVLQRCPQRRCTSAGVARSDPLVPHLRQRAA